MNIRATRACVIHHGADEWPLTPGLIYDLPEAAAIRAIGEGLAEAVAAMVPPPPGAVENAPDKAVHEAKTRRKSRRK